MKKATIFTLVLVVLIWLLPSCYKNYYDISEDALNEINSVSFRNDVIPIVVSGACGCHNNGNSSRQIRFSYYDTVSKKDTILYSAIQSRAAILYDMAKGGLHPAEGSIFFTPSQANIVRKWVEQGAKDDYVPPPITGLVTYDVHIDPLYKTDCKGSACHGGQAVALDYNSMKKDSVVIKQIMKSGGKSGHPGPVLSISDNTANYFLTWYAQGAIKN